MLTPVAFTKRKPREPRLSEPYVPGKRSPRYWTDAERAVIREHYETRGPAYCLSLLPGRTLTTVYQRAAEMGLRAPDAGTAKRQRVGTAYDAVILEAWPTMKGRGAVSRLADTLGIKRHALSQRALALGLTMPHKKEPPWTPAENELLRRAPVNNPAAASRFFAAHGFKRSESSIVVRCKRLGVSRRLTSVLSATAAAKILGIDSKTMAGWVIAGDVPGVKRGTKRLSQQGGDTWSIQPADLRRFIIDQVDRIDIRKVDKHAFVALLANEGSAT